MLVPKLRFREFNDEWNQIDLRNTFSYFSTNSLSRDRLHFSGSIMNIHYGDIHKKYGSIVDAKNEVSTFIKDLEYNNKYQLCKENDLIFADASEDYNGIGKAIELINIGNLKVVSGLHTILARDTKNEFSPKFKGYIFNSPRVHNQIRILANGFKVFGISKETINNIRILIPSKLEQTKIANTFELLDQKIELQTKKIEALKLYKKWLNKKILTDCLSNNFNTKYIKDVCSVQTGKSNTQDKDENGIYPFYIRSENIEKSNKYIFDCEAVLTIGDGNIGKVFFYTNGKFDCHQRVYVLNNFRNVKGKYLYFYFSNFFFKRAISMSAKNTVDSIRQEMITEMKINIPDEFTQDKIIKILSLTEKNTKFEIIRLNRIEELKKGLMQNLFT